MSLVTFPFRVQPKLKQAICDRARIENRTQTALIKEAVNNYLSKPHQLKQTEFIHSRLEERKLHAVINKNINTTIKST